MELSTRVPNESHVRMYEEIPNDSTRGGLRGRPSGYAH
jgi:hypothetical protein